MNRSEHLLTIVAEEAVEVAQRATKALRFGLRETQPGQPLANHARLMNEFHDLLAVLEMVHTEERVTLTIDRKVIDAKKVKIEEFLVYSRSLGTLEDAPSATTDALAARGFVTGARVRLQSGFMHDDGTIEAVHANGALDVKTDGGARCGWSAHGPNIKVLR